MPRIKTLKKTPLSPNFLAGVLGFLGSNPKPQISYPIMNWGTYSIFKLQTTKLMMGWGAWSVVTHPSIGKPTLMLSVCERMNQK
jgi:hypothetical protein